MKFHTAYSYIPVVGDTKANRMKPGFPTMPNYKCESCSFVGKNRKHLANHVALNHSTRVYRCSLCAFVTRYQANFYRHRRSIHKLNSANVCEMCGRLCESQDELVVHTSSEHPQFLDVLLRKLEAKRIRYAKYAERVNMVDGDNNHAALEQVPENDFMPEVVSGDATDEAHSENGASEEQSEGIGQSRKRPRESSPPESNKKGRTGRRTYTCSECDLVTKWPKEFLSHRKDVHGDRINIHDCPFCEYASKQPQKLQRHCNIIHKEEMNSENRRRDVKTVAPAAPQALAAAAEVGMHVQEKLFKCSSCNFHARSKVHVDEHEKTVHLKRRFYRCQQCGYVCHEKGRYTRHLRFHSLPKIKCQFCNFQTCYKWNMDRHLKYHTSDGEFRCNKCGFMTMARKSLTAHCLHHHNEILKDTSASEGENTEHENDDDDDRLMIDEDAGEDSVSPPPPLRMTLKRTGDTAVVQTSEGAMRKCRYCPQQVLWPSELKRHEATHFKMNKKHGCPLCQVRFDQLDHLEKHVTLDHQEEPSEKIIDSSPGTSAPIIIELGKTDDSTARASYSGSTQALDISIKSKQPMHTCHQCGYTTRWISELRKHELVHGNLKPFKCTYCSYTSRWKGDMTRHVFRMHKENTGAADGPSGEVEQAKSSHVLRFLLSQPKNADHDYDSKSAEASGSKDSGAMSGKFAGKHIEYQSSYQATSGVARIVQKYKCPQCSFLTRTASRFHVHMIQHLNKRPFMCSACNYRSNWQWDVNKHIKSKSANDFKHKKAELVVMDETGFKNYAKYKVHLVDVEESAKGDKVLQPTPSPKPSSEVQLVRPDETENIVVTPDILYGDQDDLAGPLPDTSGRQQLLYCGHCRFAHSDRRVVIAHLGTHTAVKPYRCRLCSFVSKWYHIVLMHVRHRHNTGPKDIENKVSFVEEGFMFRLKEEEPAPPPAPPAPPSAEQKHLKCAVCPYQCSKGCHMEFHMKQHVPREGAIFKCKYCPFYANVKKTLSRHMQLHNAEQKPIVEALPRLPMKTDAKKHSCEHCPYMSDNKTQYLYHKQFHRPNKNAPHKCTHCNYWSTHSHLMAQHLKVHKSADGTTLNGASNSGGIQAMTTIVNGTAHRMFKCRFCPLTNKRRANVKIHERMHTASKGAKFQCLLCSYRCNNTGVLASHMKLHKADNPSLDLNRMKTFCENLNALPPRPAIAKKSAQESTAAAVQRSEIAALKDKMKVVPRKKIFSYFCEKCPAMFKSHTDLDTHKTYHNSAHLYPCHLCDYRARHKPHLHKHLLVHTPEYAERQNGFTLAEIRSQDRSHNVEPEAPATPPPVAADQMLLLEKAETRAFVDAGSRGLGVQLHRCTRCPAVFQKATTLEYHISLHGSSGVYACHFCNYAANSAANVNAHTHLHYRGALKQKQPRKTFRCDKCPASFSKYNRFQKHLALHGCKERFCCSHCDYSVKFAANLVKHRKIHKVLVPESETTKPKSPTPLVVTSTPQPSEKGTEPSPAASPSESGTVAPAPAPVEEKRVYICSRCPYAFHRRETIVNHLQRHCTSEGMRCTFCDYRSVHTSTLRDHARCHFQPMRHYKPQAYMKCDSLEIWGTMSDGTRTLLFRDDGDDNYFPNLHDCNDAGENDATPSRPTSTPTSSTVSIDSSSTVSSSPELHLNNNNHEPPVMVPVEQEVDDIVSASKETLDDLVSSVVLNNSKEEMPAGCKTQVINIVVLDGTKQLSEIDEAESAHTEHKNESETACKEDGESAQDLFNRICNPDATEYEDMEDEKDVYCDSIVEDPDVSDVQCENVGSADRGALVAGSDPVLKAVKHPEDREFLNLSECEVATECKDTLLHSIEQTSQLSTADVLDDSEGSAAATDECLKGVLKMDIASDADSSCIVKELENSRSGCSSSLTGFQVNTGEADGGHLCIGPEESVLSDSPINIELDECGFEDSRYNLQPEENSPCEMQRECDFSGPSAGLNGSKQDYIPLSPCQDVNLNAHNGGSCFDEDNKVEDEEVLCDLTDFGSTNKESGCLEIREESEAVEIELSGGHGCAAEEPEAKEIDKLQSEADVAACIVQDDVVEIEIGSSLPTIKTNSGDDTVLVPQDVFEMQSPTVLQHGIVVQELDQGGGLTDVAEQGAPVDLERFPEHSDKGGCSSDVDNVQGMLDGAL